MDQNAENKTQVENQPGVPTPTQPENPADSTPNGSNQVDSENEANHQDERDGQRA